MVKKYFTNAHNIINRCATSLIDFLFPASCPICGAAVSTNGELCADCWVGFNWIGNPKCEKCGGPIKPDVVLYEEPLDEQVVTGAVHAIEAADTLLVIGTSLVVYPAASYIRFYGGDNLVIINKSKTDYDRFAKLAIYEDIVRVVEDLQK